MTIIEAIKTGNPLRRAGKASHCGSHGTGWLDADLLLSCCHRGHTFTLGCPAKSIHLTKEDILADDWEVKEKKVEITKAQLTKAWHRVMDRHTRTDSLHRPLSPCAYELAEELGLD